MLIASNGANQNLGHLSKKKNDQGFNAENKPINLIKKYLYLGSAFSG